MTEEDLELKGCPLFGTFRILFMHFLIDPANSIAIGNFKFGEILIFSIQPFIEIGDILRLFAFTKLHDYPLQLDYYVTLKFRKDLEQLWMSLFVFSVIFYAFFVQKIQNNFVYVEFEAQKQERRQKVRGLHLLCNFLDEAHLIDLPFNRSSCLISNFLLRRLVFHNFTS